LCLHLRCAIVDAIVVVDAAMVKRADAIRRMISGRKERGWMMEGKNKFKKHNKFLNAFFFLCMVIQNRFLIAVRPQY
jgi:threonine aldolase